MRVVLLPPVGLLVLLLPPMLLVLVCTAAWPCRR
jgi:hypothetical protein